MKHNRGYITGAAFTAFVAIMAFIMGLVIASNINIFQTGNTFESLAQENLSHKTPIISENCKSPFTPIAKEILPAVVNISAERIIKVRTPFFDFPFEEFFGDIPREFERKAKSLGSGIIFSKDGYILTNNHVVDGASRIIITFKDNTSFKGKQVTVVGTDSKTDIAVLKIDLETDLQYARFGDSDRIEIGDWAIAFGSPFGFNQTMTVGVISAKGRTHIPLSHGPTYQDFIQTDAAINSGNSGGPLVNINGEVIGINTAIASPSGGNVGIGFAIPINLAKSIANQLVKKGTITRGWLGVSVQELTPEIAEGLGLEETEGVIIAKVIDGSPAEKGGLRDGDIIVEFDGKPVKNMEKFRFNVAATEPEEKVSITVIRDKKEQGFSVRIGEMSGDKQIVERKNNNENWLGLTVDNINQNPVTSGVVVKQVNHGSPADKKGIEPGDIIKRIGNMYIHNTKDYRKARDIYKKYSPVTFQIKKSNGYIIFVAI